MSHDNDAVSFTANGPNALRHIRRLLAGYDLDEEDDDVSHITVEVHFEGDEPAQTEPVEQTTAPEMPPSQREKWEAPGRIRENTRHHRAMYVLCAMEEADMTPATSQDIADFAGEQFDAQLSQSDISSALSTSHKRELVERERDGSFFDYEPTEAGRQEVERLGVPHLFQTDE